MVVRDVPLKSEGTRARKSVCLVQPALLLFMDNWSKERSIFEECFPQAVRHIGMYWLYSEDKYVHGVRDVDKKLMSAIRGVIVSTYNPKHSIISESENSVYKVVNKHAHNKYILRADIRRYYSHIQYKMVCDALKDKNIPLDIIKRMYFDDSGVGLRRGFLASPMISELVGVRIVDNLIERYMHAFGAKEDGAIYSRYYDDILLSSNSVDDLRSVEEASAKALSEIGLPFNEKKTRLVCTQSSLILGLRIHDGIVSPPGRFKKVVRLRVFLAYKSYDECDFRRIEAVEKTMSVIGRAIGSVRYCRDNSARCDSKLERVYDELNDKLYELKRIRSKLSDEYPLIK